MNTTTQTQATETKTYRKTVMELYTEAVEAHIDSKKSASQVSATGNEFQGLNRMILNDSQKELGFKSNVWYSQKQMENAGLTNKEDDYGVVLFSTKLVDIEGSNKKEKVIRYYRVFNKDNLVVDTEIKEIDPDSIPF